MNYKGKITTFGSNFLSKLLTVKPVICLKFTRRSKVAVSESEPLQRRTLLARPSTLWVLTGGYFLIITFLLTLNSPERFLLGLSSKNGHSIYVFAQTHQMAIHFLSFYILAFLLCLGCRSLIGYFAVILLMAIYALVTELAQIPSPERYADVFDYLANLAGIACGAVSVWGFAQIKSRFTGMLSR